MMIAGLDSDETLGVRAFRQAKVPVMMFIQPNWVIIGIAKNLLEWLLVAWFLAMCTNGHP